MEAFAQQGKKREALSIGRKKRGIPSWACGFVLAFVMFASVKADQTVILRSGNGLPGEEDALVRCLPYETGHTPTTEDFTRAKDSSFAYIPETLNARYLDKLDSDPESQWIALNASLTGRSALYAIPFTVSDTVIAEASIELFYSVDNTLNGLYINGTAVSDFVPDGNYEDEYQLYRDDIGTLLIPGTTNWLFLSLRDDGYVAALLFSARLKIVGGTLGILPYCGTVGTVVQARIYGAAFPSDAPMVDLIDPEGNSPAINGIDPVVTNTQEISTVFDLTDADLGTRDVVIGFADTAFIIPNAFEIVEPGEANIGVEIIANTAYLAGRSFRVTVVYENRGCNDAWGVPIIVGGIPEDATVTPGDSFREPTASGDLDFSQIPVAVPADGQQYLPVVVPYVPAGGSGHFDFLVENATEPEITLTAAAAKPWLQAFLEGFGIQLRFNPDDVVCMKAIIGGVVGNLPFVESIVGEGGVATVINCVFEHAKQFTDPLTADTAGVENGLWDLASLLRECIPESLVSDVEFYKGISDAVGALQGVKDVLEACWPLFFPKERTEHTTRKVASLDPNVKLAPLGAGQEHYISAEHRLPYTIMFENKEDATAPAHDVTVVDQLPDELDLDTFRFGPVFFGTNHWRQPPAFHRSWNMVIDLRPSKNTVVSVSGRLDRDTREVTWEFRSLDPETYEPLEDPFAGFLPPNINPPEGEGGVLFTVLPRDDLSTGQEIINYATIVFDTNPAIETDGCINTIDNIRPESEVLSLLPVQESPEFEVQWIGTDVGAGLRDCTIYVSQDNGPFTRWLVDTNDTSAFFSGEPGRSYGFYSLARDFVGNIELAPTAPDVLVRTADDRRVVYRFSLDSDPRWILEGQWEYGVPTGQRCGAWGNNDPTSGHTGQNVIGVNLKGCYDLTVGGLYAAIAGPFDLTGCEDITLRFWRWLNTDIPEYVPVAVAVSTDAVNWITVWTQMEYEAITDTQWTLCEYLIPQFDDQSHVYVRWSYEIRDDMAYVYTGWNIDDIELSGQ